MARADQYRLPLPKTCLGCPAYDPATPKQPYPSLGVCRVASWIMPNENGEPAPHPGSPFLCQRDRAESEQNRPSPIPRGQRRSR